MLCFAHLLVDDENEEEEEERAVYTRGAVDEHEAAEAEEEGAAREKSLEDIPHTDTFFVILFFCEESARQTDRNLSSFLTSSVRVTNNFFTKKFFLLYEPPRKA